MYKYNLMTAICHLVGLDEIHKINLIKKLSKEMYVIDLDRIQLKIQKNYEILKQKNKWSKISAKIITIKKHRQLILADKILDDSNLPANKKRNNQIFETQLKNLVDARNNTKMKIHDTWKRCMNNEITNQIQSNKNIIYVGFNIYPKDYRIKVDLNLNKNATVNNTVVFNIHPKLYSANQIKYYLHVYSDKIINGEFPLHLLKSEYLSNKYDKFVAYYSKKKYILKNKNQIVDYIKKIKQNLSNNVKYGSIELVGGLNLISHELSGFVVSPKQPILSTSYNNLEQLVDSGKPNVCLVNNSLNSTIVDICENKLNKSNKIMSNFDKSNKIIYVPTMFKTGSIIPVNKTTPIQGYYTKQEAINAVRDKIKNNRPIYIHKTNDTHFSLISGQLMSKLPVNTFDEESILIT